MSKTLQTNKMRALLFIMILLIPIPVLGEIVIQGEKLNLGTPNILTEKTPKSFRTTVDGELALTREIRSDGRNHQLIFINNKIAGVGKSIGKPGNFEHSINLGQNDNLIQLVYSCDQTYVIIRAIKDQKVLRVLRLDKKKTYIEVVN